MQNRYGYEQNYSDDYDPYSNLEAGYQAAQAAVTGWDGGTWHEEEWDEPNIPADAFVHDYGYEAEPNTAVQPDIILWGGVAFVILLLLVGAWRWFSPAVPLATPADAPPPTPAPLVPPQFDPAVVIFPYDDYVLTQGPHGYSYGHMAIDISAGNGATIKSPIFGAVTQFYFDGLGNSVLVIENDKYQITMLHGAYTVEVGDTLQPGDTVGTESNIGNTYDWAGNSCRGRDCGYHTHLNIFYKELGRNVNPLELYFGAERASTLSN